MAVDSDDGGHVQAASVACKLEGFLGKYHRNGVPQVISGENTDVVVERSGVERITQEQTGGVDDEDVVFVSGDDYGQCCRAGGGQSTDVVGSDRSVKHVCCSRAESVTQVPVVGTVDSPVGRFSEEIAGIGGGHGGAWLALNGFNAN